MLPEDERIPVRNWRKGPDLPSIVHVQGYLLEMNSLQGLSGSPVFVRPTIDMADLPVTDGTKITTRLPAANVKLLGVWQSAWSGDPDAVLMQEIGDKKVPVGIGIVVPIARLVEVLESPVAVQSRAKFVAKLDAALAAQPEVKT